MFRKFAARNFRCFQDFKFEPLARVNLIVGENNVGKTALLEALNLHCLPSVTENAFGANFLRGASGSNAAIWRELDWLFYEKRIKDEIELESVHDAAGKSELRVRLVQPEERSLLPAKPNGESQSDLNVGATTAGLNELTMVYEDRKGEEYTSRARLVPVETMSYSSNIDPLEIKFSSSNVEPFGRAVRVLKHLRFPDAYAELYSALVEAGRESELLSALQALDPRIRRLELLYRGNLPVFHVDIGNIPLMPLFHMGEGITHVLSWLLVIKTYENGTVLIDEFENGLHYGALVDAWKAVGAAARNSNVQVFATTHSWECVKAAHNAFAESGEDEFRLHRLERRDGDIVAITYDQEQLATSVEFGFEVR